MMFRLAGKQGLSGARKFFLLSPPIVRLAVVSAMATTVLAQSSLTIYSDQLANGWQDWSWCARDLANTSPVHTGTRSIRATATAWQGVSFWRGNFDSSPYSHFVFWAHGGPTGGQRVQVYAELNGTGQPAYVVPGSFPANTWQEYEIPLSALGVANQPDFSRITIQLRGDGATGTFYLDDLELAAAAPPASVGVSVNATQAIGTVDARHFGVNCAMWDPYYDPPHHTTTINLLDEMDCRVVRMPGGSLSDEYHWALNITRDNTWQWQASFADMVRVATNAGVQAFVVVNYGSGTPEEAAGWVRHANVTNQLGFRYWEIGNECYGNWEYDLNINPHDPYTYANRAFDYMAQMRAADPTIKIGVVAAVGENSYSNQFTALHPAYNQRTGQNSYGWTPIMLHRLKQLGVTPDFLVHHHYPYWTNPSDPASSPVNDEGLLASTSAWAGHAADLRQQIQDYFGSGGDSIELVVTENNADAGQQGRQSTSLVNGLYYADSLGELMKTEFKGMIWWDLRNSTDTKGFFGPDLYGWRTYGDLGMINGPSTRHPAFYAAKLLQWFARPGDSVVPVASDYSLLAAHAARRANGSLSLLVINKSKVNTLTGQIALNGFVPGPDATLRSFGIPNDEATRTNGPAAAQDITSAVFSGAHANFNYPFPPLSLTLLTLAPEPPVLAAARSAPDKVIVQIRGQPAVPYVLQSSTNMLHWTSSSTNILTGSTLSLTNPVPQDATRQFWRAAWIP